MNEPLKFFKVKIEVYPAIAKNYPYSEGHDFEHAEVADKPIIVEYQNISGLYDDDYLGKLILDKMLEIGRRELYSKCPDARLLEEK